MQRLSRTGIARPTVTFANSDVLRSWINGAFVPNPFASTPSPPLDPQFASETRPPSNKDSMDFVYDPCTNEPLFAVACASSSDVEAAVTAAATAQKAWQTINGLEKGRILRKAALLLDSRKDELAKIEALDSGRSIAETSVVDIQSAIDCLDYFAGVASNMSGQYMDLNASMFAYTRREPLGVCAGIGAWNYPLQSAAWKAAPALACGNSLIFKPSEETPLTALAFAEILTEAGLPDGLFNVLLGGGEVGAQLCEHRNIAKVSFTGSRATGLKVQQTCASQSIKRITLELGGKSPLIIFDDADLEQATRAIMMANFYSNGQVCSNGTRVFLQKNVFKKIKEELVRRTNAMAVGDSMDSKSDITSIINQQQADKVRQYVRTGVEEGAALIVGAENLEPSANATQSNIIFPSIFAQCGDDMKIVQEEIFGPVICLLVFDTEAEVIERANNTDFGLSAGVFTRDLNRAHSVIAHLEAGTTWINDYNLAFVELPWGGYKQSGLGRENGVDAINHWTQLKSVTVNSGEVWCPYN